MDKDLLEEYQNDECVKSCEDCVFWGRCRKRDYGVCYEFERWMKDEN
ncbi:MAG TPA: hypothetical protein VIK78_03260 [Ruminiclostridium sp.]